MKRVKCNAGKRARAESDLRGSIWSVRMKERVREGISNITLSKKIMQTDEDGGQNY